MAKAKRSKKSDKQWEGLWEDSVNKKKSKHILPIGTLIIMPLLPPERKGWARLLDHKGNEICLLDLTKKGNLKPSTKDFFELPIGEK